MSYKDHFSLFLDCRPGRLHFAAHSHHLWPDVAFEAHRSAWTDAAEMIDHKWDRIMAEIIPRAQGHIARTLGLSDPSTIAFAPNTHQFVLRLFSCLEGRPVRLLSSDGEFHSFTRQSMRWEEAGLAEVDRISAEPLSTFPDRFLRAAASGGHDMVFVSQVFFDSGFLFERFAEVAEAVPDPSTFVVIDGYHGFMAVPTDFGPLEGRAFYIAGGYKYAMSGEGTCFLHCPPGYGPRPVDTGWFAGFADLELGVGSAVSDEGGVATGAVSFEKDGSRFLGATFDPTPLYRFCAVMDLWQELGVEVSDIHRHVRALQDHFLAGIDELGLDGIASSALLPDTSFADRGHFLVFRTGRAEAIYRALDEMDVIVDYRADRLRIGFGLYHDEADVDELLHRLEKVRG